jgi:DnaA family protein
MKDTPASSLPSQLTLNFPVEEEWNFSTFITESLNDALMHALKNLSDVKESPIYIWGEPESGKSHLLQALCQQIEDSMYLPSREILEYGPEILEGLEGLKLVCLDDIQVMKGSEDWQLALFALFNRARETGCLLVMSADCPLAQLGFKLADLTSRIQWGPVYQVHALSDEGKTRLLEEAAERRGIRLSGEVVSYILNRSERSITSLYGVLNKLDELSLAEKRRITQPYIKSIMGW